ncbi:hypothetical protein D3C80_1506640 [compost metagenome]
MLIDLRAAAKHTHVFHHPRSTLHLGIDAGELFLQVVHLRLAIFQAFQSVDHGHAHHVQGLVDLMGKSGGHLAEGSHFRALHQLLTGTPYLGVVAPHRLDFQQLAVLIEQTAVGPHPPRMLAAR